MATQHRLEARDRWFLAKGLCDPVTKMPFAEGQVVVLCARCRMPHGVSTWGFLPGRPCSNYPCAGTKLLEFETFSPDLLRARPPKSRPGFRVREDGQSGGAARVRTPGGALPRTAAVVCCLLLLLPPVAALALGTEGVEASVLLTPAREAARERVTDAARTLEAFGGRLEVPTERLRSRRDRLEEWVDVAGERFGGVAARLRGEEREET